MNKSLWLDLLLFLLFKYNIFGHFLGYIIIGYLIWDVWFRRIQNRTVKL